MNEIFEKTARKLKRQGFKVVAKDHNRPWGGFFVLDEDQAPKFIETYFPGYSVSDFAGFSKLSPKILVVAPEKRLSWQYHFRRAEIWRVLSGPIGVAQSATDEQNAPDTYINGDIITLPKGQRHRLVGLADWGIVAEIWQHTDVSNPSDEDDIVRLQDDFGR
jgi:mannose-6-phosphate isomerase